MTPSKASSTSKTPKVLILDGHSLAFRAFYALPEDLQTTDGTYTNAVYGFTAMLIKMLQDEKPDYIACCFDMGRPLQRTEQFADYKATRTEAPERFSPQLPLIREVLRVLRIPIFELGSLEFDNRRQIGIGAFKASFGPRPVYALGGVRRIRTVGGALLDLARASVALIRRGLGHYASIDRGGDAV
jgi:5'-3' exonuclease